MPRRDSSQILLNVERVRVLMNGRAPKEIEKISRKRIQACAIRRVLLGESISRSLAEHLAEALGVKSDDLLKENVP